MDVAWGGVPFIALGGQNKAIQRSSESIAYSHRNEFGIVYSLKEYEDIVVALIKTKQGRMRLDKWKHYSNKIRLYSNFFNPIHFSNVLIKNFQAMHEVSSVIASVKNQINLTTNAGSNYRSSYNSCRNSSCSNSYNTTSSSYNSYFHNISKHFHIFHSIE